MNKVNLRLGTAFLLLRFFEVLCAALTLAVHNDPEVEVKNYADASLTSKSIFVPPNSLRQANLRHGR